MSVVAPRRTGGADIGSGGTTDDGRRGLLAGVGLASATPLLVWQANPPGGLWPLIFVAFVPMVVAQHRVLPPRWSWLALAIGIGGSYAAYFSPGLADGEVAIVFQLLPLYVGLIAAVIGGRSAGFARRTGYRWFAVSVPVAWAAIEFLRSSGNETLGGTWGYHAYALARHPALLQPVSVFGITGLQLLIFLVNFAAAAAALRTPRWRRDLAIAGALLVAWGGASVLMLDDEPAVVRVAAVQAGLPNDDEHAADRFARLVEQTRDAAGRGARLIVWSEGGLTFDPQAEHTVELRALAADTDAFLVLGYRMAESGGLFRNATTVLAPDGQFLGVYGKDHPGTFAGDLNDFQGDFPVYDTEIGAFATIICYDLDYTDTARIMTRGGARLIATPSSDVPAIARTHWPHLVFRAIENRVSMVKADSRFDSAIIDPWGRVITHSEDPGGDMQVSLVADVPLGTGRSPWVSFGNWLGWLLVAGTAGFVAMGLADRWRARAAGRRA